MTWRLTDNIVFCSSITAWAAYSSRIFRFKRNERFGVSQQTRVIDMLRLGLLPHKSKTTTKSIFRIQNIGKVQRNIFLIYRSKNQTKTLDLVATPRSTTAIFNHRLIKSYIYWGQLQVLKTVVHHILFSFNLILRFSYILLYRFSRI